MTDPRPVQVRSPDVLLQQVLDTTSVANSRRPRGAIVAFVFLVVIPAIVSGWYLWTVAADRYASRTAFSIRSNEATAPLEIFGAISQLGSSSAAMDGEILYDFARSQPMLDAVSQRIDLRSIYSKHPEDRIFSLPRDRPVEDLLEHWSLMTKVSLDRATGILTIEARAFSEDDAQRISQAVLDASVDLVNEISEAARADSVRYAALELEEAESRLRLIRTRLRAFRDLEQDVDPTRNAEAALGLVAMLEEDRAQAQVRLDQITGVLNGSAPRILALKRKIDTLDARIADERTRLGSGTIDGKDGPRPLAAIVGEYEELLVDREFAEQAYTLALATYEQAQAEARRQNRYLAVHIRPTLAETPDYPDRPVLFGTIILLGLASWSITCLVCANVRERR